MRSIGADTSDGLGRATTRLVGVLDMTEQLG